MYILHKFIKTGSGKIYKIWTIMKYTGCLIIVKR